MPLFIYSAEVKQTSSLVYYSLNKAGMPCSGMIKEENLDTRRKYIATDWSVSRRKQDITSRSALHDFHYAQEAIGNEGSIISWALGSAGRQFLCFSLANPCSSSVLGAPVGAPRA